jgi:hypothetical protein
MSKDILSRELVISEAAKRSIRKLIEAAKPYYGVRTTPPEHYPGPPIYYYDLLYSRPKSKYTKPKVDVEISWQKEGF